MVCGFKTLCINVYGWGKQINHYMHSYLLGLMCTGLKTSGRSKDSSFVLIFFKHLDGWLDEWRGGRQRERSGEKDGWHIEWWIGPRLRLHRNLSKESHSLPMWRHFSLLTTCSSFSGVCIIPSGHWTVSVRHFWGFTLFFTELICKPSRWIEKESMIGRASGYSSLLLENTAAKSWSSLSSWKQTRHIMSKRNPFPT